MIPDRMTDVIHSLTLLHHLVSGNDVCDDEDNPSNVISTCLRMNPTSLSSIRGYL